MAKKLKIPGDVARKVVLLDCNKEENVRKLEQFLTKLPFIKDKERVDDIAYLEEIQYKLEKKFSVRIGYITFKEVEEKRVYQAMIKGPVGDKEHSWLENVEGITLWEALAKSIFFMYYFISLPEDKREAKGGF